jgi:GT2 family glycosyltransferase
MGVLYLLTVNYHSADLIQRWLRSLNDATFSDWHCLIVNNSPDDTAIHQFAESSVTVLEAGSNLGFGGGCNVGLQWVYERDSAAMVWLLNPDTVLPPEALKQAVEFCQTHPELSIIGTVVQTPTGDIWFAGGAFEANTGKILAIESALEATVDYIPTAWVTGCSLILNLQGFKRCPEFDPAYFLYYEDFDFCRRYADQGHAIALTPHIQVIHYPSSITSRNLGLKVKHSTYSYLLALTRHTQPAVVLYRLGRILAHALRKSVAEPQKAIAIIKGVLKYLGSSRESSRHH